MTPTHPARHPGPLAPAQSKRTFAFSGKTRKSIERTSISASFFSPFFTLFRGVSRKTEKGAQGQAREPQKHTKMDPKGAQTEPRYQQTKPQGPTKYEKHSKEVTKGGKVEPQALQWRRRAPRSARKAQKNVSQSANKTRKCAARCRKTPKHT